MKYAIVLGAGKGTRMKSKINKVMHKVVDKPIIGHIVDNLEKCGVTEINVVVGFQKEQIMDYLKDRVTYTHQDEQLGTAHALDQVTTLREKDGKTLIMVGDCPLVQPSTIQQLFDASDEADCVLLSAQMSDPSGYGRVIRDNQGLVKAIIEAREATDEQRAINEINTGIYVFDNQLLFKYLSEVTNENSSGEYYLTDLIHIFNKNDLRIKAIRVKDNKEVMGINNRIQLSHANAWYQHRINQHWMNEGVTLLDPTSTYISLDTEIEQDVTIYPNVNIKGKSFIKEGATIYPNSWIENSVIGQNSVIDASKIVDSEVKNDVVIGPFSHLRMHSIVDDKVRIGNFVELKNTHMKEKARSAHLTYLGDSEIGEDVNIGCGVVTVNYDGKNKFKTIVKDHAFVGSNSNLIAPITIGEYAVVAAGSTVSDDVKDNSMVIERAQLVTKEEKGKKYILKERDKE